MSTSQINPHRNREWLAEKINNNMSYAEIAKEAGVKELTIVNWLLKFDLFYNPVQRPPDIFDNIEFSVILKGNPVTKKNSRSFGGGRPAPNKRYYPYSLYYVSYLKKIASDLNMSLPLSDRYILTCNFFRGDKRRVDISGLYEAPQDILVESGILVDDMCSVIIGHDESRVYYDKENPRTELYIRRVQ